MNYLSPFALALDVTQTVTTQLDETGLVTPKVAVTDGIEMNGSRITGLANGTASTDAVNMSQLDAEANARIAGDTALGNNLAAEAAARANADFQIGQRILVEENARNELATNLATEAATRAAADLSLSNQIGGLDSRIDALEGRMNQFDDKIASSTAVAVAMSGNAFLPNTRFNLTANMGTYGGAQAGALQIGAMLSDHVAVNAGVATGFNKGGKTAGRVGFTVGW
jgi:hypothetical protein